MHVFTAQLTHFLGSSIWLGEGMYAAYIAHKSCIQLSSSIALCAKNRKEEVDSIFGEWCYVRMPRLSSLLQGSTALLRARLVHVCVTEYDRATSNYIPRPFYTRGR